MEGPPFQEEKRGVLLIKASSFSPEEPILEQMRVAAKAASRSQGRGGIQGQGLLTVPAQPQSECRGILRPPGPPLRWPHRAPLPAPRRPPSRSGRPG